MVLGIKLGSSSLARQVLYQLGTFSTPGVHTRFQKVRFHVSTEDFILKHELQCISVHQFFQIYLLTAKVEYIVVVELMCLLRAFAVRISSQPLTTEHPQRKGSTLTYHT